MKNSIGIVVIILVVIGSYIGIKEYTKNATSFKAPTLKGIQRVDPSTQQGTAASATPEQQAEQKTAEQNPQQQQSSNLTPAQQHTAAIEQPTHNPYAEQPAEKPAPATKMEPKGSMSVIRLENNTIQVQDGKSINKGTGVHQGLSYSEGLAARALQSMDAKSRAEMESKAQVLQKQVDRSVLKNTELENRRREAQRRNPVNPRE